MKPYLLCLLMMAPMIFNAQSSNTFYGLARRNNPNNEIFLATADPATGVVTNVSSTNLSPLVNLTGAALDPYNNYYHFIGYNEIKSVNLTTGVLANSVLINNPIADSYFDNFRFNNSDTSLYGLARRVIYDSINNTYLGQVYLATIHVGTGTINQLSPSSVGQGFALAGSAINPYQKVYYYSDGSHIIGLDMYTGGVYSTAPITMTNGTNFDNFAYSCVDSIIYGLIRQNYYDSLYDSVLMQYITFVDSTTIHLGKIDPATGVVTTISPYSISQGGYSLNSGSTIDPSTMTYYYNNGYQLVGVSLATGLIVTQPNLTYSNGQFFELMRIQSSCYNAKTPIRSNPGFNPTVVNDRKVATTFTMFPNPCRSEVMIESNEPITGVELYDLFGRLQRKVEGNGRQQTIKMADLSAGTYLIKMIGENKEVGVQRLVKQN